MGNGTVDLDGEQVIAAEARIDTVQKKQAFCEQASGGEQHHRERDFGNDDQLTQAAALRCVPTAAFQLNVDIAAREFPGWSESENQSS